MTGRLPAATSVFLLTTAVVAFPIPRLQLYRSVLTRDDSQASTTTSICCTQDADRNVRCVNDETSLEVRSKALTLPY